MPTPFDTLARELDAESYRWLSDNHPTIADAVADSVQRGASPDAVRRFVLERCGADRYLLATRCESAARHLSEAVKA